MTAMTPAERARRYRSRRRASDSPVRSFLTAVTAAAQAAIEDQTVTPWLLARADRAHDLLDLLDAPEAGLTAYRPGRVNRTDDEFEADFRAWLPTWSRDHASAPAKARRDVTAKAAQSMASLTWAAGELAAGRGTSPVLAQGLRACQRLLAEREAPETEAARAYFGSFAHLYTASQRQERRGREREAQYLAGGSRWTYQPGDPEHNGTDCLRLWGTCDAPTHAAAMYLTAQKADPS